MTYFQSVREIMLKNLHLTHSSDGMMLLNAKKKIFWPQVKCDLTSFYETCPKCLMHKRSKAQASMEISYKNLIENFETVQQLQADFNLELVHSLFMTYSCLVH